MAQSDHRAHLTIVEWDSGDWIALYEDGRFRTEGHSLDHYEWADILNDLDRPVSICIRRLTARASDKWSRAPCDLARLGTDDFDGKEYPCPEAS